MKLSYESTLDDLVEPSLRLYLRSKTYATTRWRGAAFCAAAFGIFAFLGFNAKENVNLPVICTAAAAWGAGLFLLTYKGTVRRRIKNYLANELKGGPWPRPADYEIKDGQLIGTGSGVNTRFALADFTGATEDGGRLELAFLNSATGNQGLCVIPLRAFESTDEKNSFLAALHP